MIGIVIGLFVICSVFATLFAICACIASARAEERWTEAMLNRQAEINGEAYPFPAAKIRERV